MCDDDDVGEHDDELVVDDRVVGDMDDSDDTLLLELLLLLLTPSTTLVNVAAEVPISVLFSMDDDEGKRTTSGSCDRTPATFGSLVAISSVDVTPLAVSLPVLVVLPFAYVANLDG